MDGINVNALTFNNTDKVLVHEARYKSIAVQTARRLSLTIFCSFYRVLTVGAASVVKTAPPREVWSDDGDNSAKVVVHVAAARVTKVMLWIRTQPSRKEQVTRNLSCKVHYEAMYERNRPYSRCPPSLLAL